MNATEQTQQEQTQQAQEQMSAQERLARLAATRIPMWALFDEVERKGRGRMWPVARLNEYDYWTDRQVMLRLPHGAAPRLVRAKGSNVTWFASVPNSWCYGSRLGNFEKVFNTRIVFANTGRSISWSDFPAVSLEQQCTLCIGRGWHYGGGANTEDMLENGYGYGYGYGAGLAGPCAMCLGTGTVPPADTRVEAENGQLYSSRVLAWLGKLVRGAAQATGSSLRWSLMRDGGADRCEPALVSFGCGYALVMPCRRLGDDAVGFMRTTGKADGKSDTPPLHHNCGNGPAKQPSSAATAQTPPPPLHHTPDAEKSPQGGNGASKPIAPALVSERVKIAREDYLAAIDHMLERGAMLQQGRYDDAYQCTVLAAGLASCAALSLSIACQKGYSDPDAAFERSKLFVDAVEIGMHLKNNRDYLLGLIGAGLAGPLTDHAKLALIRYQSALDGTADLEGLPNG